MSTDATHLPATILVVDDTPANLQLLTSMLRESGYKVRPVSSGEMALRVVETTPPDLVLLDINMPDMDGYEVCRRLKADARLRDIPVLFISALSDTADKVRAFQAGGVDYVGKPFQYEEVDARIRTHLELRRKSQALAESLSKLQEMEKLRDNLTHMIAHDMRSPLLALQMSIQLLAEAVNTADSNTATLASIARRGTAQLVEMVSQMLDVSRMEAGKMELQRTTCDLVGLARETITTLQPLAAGRTLSVDSAPELIAEVDRNLIRRVLQNLLGNAIKFTQAPGHICIVLRGDEKNVRVSVVDDGLGIAPEDQPKIFEKFSQTASGSRLGGSGLGLTFCRIAIETHGGRIGVESTSNRGSTFWFSLPTAHAPSPASHSSGPVAAGH